MQVTFDIDAMTPSQRGTLIHLLAEVMQISVAPGAMSIITGSDADRKEFVKAHMGDPTGLQADTDNEKRGELEASAAFGKGGAAAPAPLPPSDVPSTAAAAVFAIVPGSAPAAPPPPGSQAPAPAPVPPGSVPSAPAETSSPAPAVDLDKHGLPWDARIHAGSKAKNADGSWRMKPKLDPATKTAVEAELRQLMTIPATGANQPGSGHGAQFAPQPPSGPVATHKDYMQLVSRCSAAIHTKKVTEPEVTGICAKYGVVSLPLLAHRLDLFGVIAGEVDTLIASRG